MKNNKHCCHSSQQNYWIVGGLLFLIVIGVFYYTTRTIKYEAEVTCNTGFIGIDFSERFVFNESSSEKELISFNPQKFDIRGINGLTCNVKFKGELPLSKVVEVLGNV